MPKTQFRDVPEGQKFVWLAGNIPCLKLSLEKRYKGDTPEHEEQMAWTNAIAYRLDGTQSHCYCRSDDEVETE
jgi:hypothetical protein